MILLIASSRNTHNSQSLESHNQNPTYGSIHIPLVLQYYVYSIGAISAVGGSSGKDERQSGKVYLSHFASHLTVYMYYIMNYHVI